jgi:hypothetical protein
VKELLLCLFFLLAVCVRFAGYKMGKGCNIFKYFILYKIFDVKELPPLFAPAMTELQRRKMGICIYV